MIGGTVIETVDAGDRIWINCQIKTSGITHECAINVERDAKALTVADGDTVWWQGKEAMWTPKGFHPNGKSGIDFDIRLKRIGYSGAQRPARNWSAHKRVLSPNDKDHR